MLSYIYYRSMGMGRLDSSSDEEEDELETSLFRRLSEICFISFLNCSTLNVGVSLAKSVDD